MPSFALYGYGDDVLVLDRVHRSCPIDNLSQVLYSSEFLEEMFSGKRVTVLVL